MRCLYILIIATLLILPSTGRTDPPALSPCVCDDDCNDTWPYTGICTESGWGQRYCDWGGPGIPCSIVDGGPEIADAMPHNACSCNDDCEDEYFCNDDGWGALVCTSQAPGIECMMRIDTGEPRPADGGGGVRLDVRFPDQWDIRPSRDFRELGQGNNPSADGGQHELADEPLPERSGCALGGKARQELPGGLLLLLGLAFWGLRRIRS